MYEYVTEIDIPLSDANTLLEQICRPITGLCHSVPVRDRARILEFEDGYAVVGVADTGLVCLVAAENILTFLGIRTVLETRLFKFSHSKSQWIRGGPAECEFTENH
ncbi:SMa0974 family conjugal transfer regulator [Rhizobium sp. BR 362]|uniref:SMa0974 family conjugal transfer regulator n=1 Tax=Rhizobium sp. BR 362 TaxID=3040670 RepID=UPI003FA73826